MKLRNALVAATLGTLMGAAAPALAQPKPGPATPELADGEVRRIDAAKGSILLKHGAIKAINMGPMTMAFKLKDPALATGLQVGDKVKFAAEQQSDQLVVTRIDKVK